VTFAPPIFDSDTILDLIKKPKTMAVMGGGVIGCEYASIYANLGIKVSLYDRRRILLRDLDDEILEALKLAFTKAGISLRLGEETEVKVNGSVATIKTDKDEMTYEAVLYCQGRSPNVEELNLAALGLTPTVHGTIAVSKSYQTECQHIYVVGDLQGAPGLATSAAEQGRMAAATIFNHFGGNFPESFPYGVYTIPEISSVGPNEAQLRERNIPFVIGRAKYSELARGKIVGDSTGLLKLFVHRETKKILSVHVIGTQATELIHIGQVAIALGADLNFFVSNVFNYPTFAEAYKVAAFQAFNTLSN
jgi:NAD(P) transhydrogenase